MEFRVPTSPKEVVESFCDNWIPWVDVPMLLLPFITEHNVDAILGELPGELRDYFVEYAEANLVQDDHPVIVISSSGHPPEEPPREAVLAVRGWLARRR